MLLLSYILLGVFVALAVSIYAFVRFLKTRQKTYLIGIFSGGILVLVLCTYLTYWVVKKTYQKVQGVTVFKQRTGLEMYNALMGSNICAVNVLHQRDQVIPKVDCCIWLEFKTCSEEMQRILSLQPYTLKTVPETHNYSSSFQEQPDWWKPQESFKDVLYYEYFIDANRSFVLVTNKELTHAFYCDMAE